MQVFTLSSIDIYVAKHCWLLLVLAFIGLTIGIIFDK